MGVEEAPHRRRRREAAKRRQEKRWAARSGPVTVRFVDPSTLGRGMAAPPTQPQSAPGPTPGIEGDERVG